MVLHIADPNAKMNAFGTDLPYNLKISSYFLQNMLDILSPTEFSALFPLSDKTNNKSKHVYAHRHARMSTHAHTHPEREAEKTQMGDSKRHRKSERYM